MLRKEKVSLIYSDTIMKVKTNKKDIYFVVCMGFVMFLIVSWLLFSPFGKTKKRLLWIVVRF